MKRQQIRKLIVILMFLFLPVTFYYFSPYLIVMGAAEAVITGSAVVFALQFLSGMFVGRAFCGWLCPTGGLQEICSPVITRRAMLGKGRFVKYVLWIFWLALIALFYLHSTRGGRTLSLDFFYQTDHGFSISAWYVNIVFYMVLLVILLPLFLAGRRGACHTVCWMAPFLVLGDKFGRLLRIPTIQLRTESSRCIGCQKCDSVCQMSLPVCEMVKNNRLTHTDCIKCLECVDACPKKALSIGYGLQK